MDELNKTSGEIWKAVVGYEDYYEVSNLGRVRRVKLAGNTYVGKILAHHIDPKWKYHSVQLCMNAKQKMHKVSKLVAEAFLGECPAGYESNHINGDKANNSVSNLEYLTHSDNMKHAYLTGLKPRPLGGRNPRAILNKEIVLEMINLKRQGYTAQEIKKELKIPVSLSTIWAATNGSNWSYECSSVREIKADLEAA